MADAPEPVAPAAQEQPAPLAASGQPGGEEEPEAELSLAHYFGGYALIFLGVIGLALVFVLFTKLMR
jgi:hypothetical protein